MPGSKGLNPHELAHRWVKDLGTRPDMSIKVGYISHDMRILGRIVGVRSTEQSVGIIVGGFCPQHHIIRGGNLMTGSDRRSAIVERIRNSDVPVSGKTLAAAFDVSRQVIVQDIALIRAAGYDIISTNRGYIINEPHLARRVFKVRHTDEQLEEELNAIVDLGGRVCDVIVNHRVYGRLEAELNITSRRKVAEFIADIKNGKSSPLKNITSDYHYHTVEADSEETLDLIGNMLREKGFLIES